MKTQIRILMASLFTLIMAGFYGCEKNTENTIGLAEFAVSLPEAGLKSVSVEDSTVNTFQLLISIEDMNGTPVITDRLIPLYTFGTSFVSEKIELRTGEFRLVKFMVITPSGTIRFAAPVAGSPMAYLTTRPLPIVFNINEGAVTKVTPEVLAVGDSTPDKFGYAAFGVSVIRPLTFWAGAVIDNPMIMAPFPLFTEARLTVFAGDDFQPDAWHYTFKLSAGINRIVVRGGFEKYSLLLEKDGYLPQKFHFTAARLLETSVDRPLYLKIPWDALACQKFVLQPGPDEGKDAMISDLEPDKNFGAHKYFEATFMSEPVLTVMRLNRSLIAFKMPATLQAINIKKVVLTLWYEVPIPWDSTIFAGTSANDFIGGVLQQVVEPWEEDDVTWNNQPKTIETKQVFISPFIRNTNMIDIDVTGLFVPSSENSLPGYGMLFKLYPENKWRGFRFASSDYPEPSMRPRLTIFYTSP